MAWLLPTRTESAKFKFRHLSLFLFQLTQARMATEACPAYAPFFGFAGVGAAVSSPFVPLTLRPHSLTD